MVRRTLPAVTRRSASLVLVAAVALLAPQPAAAQIAVPTLDLDLVWDATYDAANDKYVYRYVVTNQRNTQRIFRITVTEDQDGGHTGRHDENAFLVPPGAVFQRDAVLVGLPAHNYDWSNVTFPPSGTITLGFDDPNAHGPHGETFGFSVGSQRVKVFGIPVPGDPVWALRLDLTETRFKQITLVGATATPLAGGLWQYKHFVRNTGNVPIGNQDHRMGPCPDDDTLPDRDNYADVYINEHPSHRRVVPDDEVLNLPDNMLGNAKLNSTGHGGLGLPAGIVQYNYAFEELGNGPAFQCWMPGRTLVLGWTDPHGPARVPTAGRVVGSLVEGFFPEEYQLIPVPSRGLLEIPTATPWGLGAMALVLALGALWLLRRRLRSPGG